MSLNRNLYLRQTGAGLFAVASLGLLTVVTGCNTGTPSSSSTGTPKAAETIATVNGEVIDTSLMFDAMQHYVPVKSQNDANSPILTQPVGRVVLTELIQSVVLQQLANEKNVSVTPTLVDDRFNYIKALEEKSNTTKPFDEFLAQEGYTADTFKDEQVKPLVARLNLVSIGQTVSDADIDSYFKAHQEKYTFPARVHIQRVVLADKATADAARVDAQKTGSFKNYIPKNIDPPLPGGSDESDIAKWEPIGGSGVQFPPTLLNPLKAAKSGDVLTPIQLQPGRWWVIKVVDSQPEFKMPFDQIKGLVKQDLLAEKGMRSSSVVDLQQSLQTALQTAKITIIPKQYQSVADQFKAKPAAAQPMGAPAGAPEQAPAAH